MNTGKRRTNRKRSGLARCQRGVTLTELLTVVAIISIVAAISYPSYEQFVIRAKRNAGTSMLLQIADLQQQYFMDNKRYASTLTNLGYSGESIMISDDGHVVSSGDDKRIYQISLSNTTATTYTLTATPQMRQAEKDKSCANLTLTHAGEKGQSGSGTNCW